MLTLKERADRLLGATVRVKGTQMVGRVVGYDEKLKGLLVTFTEKPRGVLCVEPIKPVVLAACDAFLKSIPVPVVIKVEKSKRDKNADEYRTYIRYHLNKIVTYEETHRLRDGLLVGYTVEKGKVKAVVRMVNWHIPKKSRVIPFDEDNGSDYISPGGTYGFSTDIIDTRVYSDVVIDLKDIRVTGKEVEKTDLENAYMIW